MDMMRLSAAAGVLSGQLSGEDCEFLAASTDTRTIRPGDLFVALKGERFDGAAFAQQAIELGAAGVMLNIDAVTQAAPAIRVADTRIGLGRLTGAAISRFRSLPSPAAMARPPSRK
jgi:UDP-N-acetylmuramoyl-tripeptide--D-alanyl-D-alanine ligase